jgi:hypothetical protein
MVEETMTKFAFVEKFYWADVEHPPPPGFWEHIEYGSLLFDYVVPI